MSPAFRLVWEGGIQRNRLIGSSRWPYFVSSDLRVTGCVTSISYLSRAPEESISFIRSTPAIHHLSFPFVLLFFFPYRVILRLDHLFSPRFFGGGERKVRKFDRANDGPSTKAVAHRGSLSRDIKAA